METPIFFGTPAAFDRWLDDNGDRQGAVWVGFYRKGSGRESLTWPDSVDVALCHGWIDGVRKSIDDQSYKIRFSPRKPESVWSAVNVRKAEALGRRGKLRPKGARLFHARRDRQGYSSESRNMRLDPAFEARLRENRAAWAYFSGLAPSYRRDSIWWVMSAKREETRRKRLAVLIELSAAGQKIPMLRK